MLTRESVVFHDETGAVVERKRQPLQAGSLLVDKGNYRHYMAKEIHEQPEVVGRTLAHYLDLAAGVGAAAVRSRLRRRGALARDDFRLRHGLLRGPRRPLLAGAVRAAAR